MPKPRRGSIMVHPSQGPRRCPMAPPRDWPCFLFLFACSASSGRPHSQADGSPCPADIPTARYRSMSFVRERHKTSAGCRRLGRPTLLKPGSQSVARPFRPHGFLQQRPRLADAPSNSSWTNQRRHGRIHEQRLRGIFSSHLHCRRLARRTQCPRTQAYGSRSDSTADQAE